MVKNTLKCENVPLSHGKCLVVVNASEGGAWLHVLSSTSNNTVNSRKSGREKIYIYLGERTRASADADTSKKHEYRPNISAGRCIGRPLL